MPARITESRDRLHLVGTSYRLTFHTDAGRTTGLDLVHVNEEGEVRMGALRYVGRVYQSHEDEPMEMTAAAPEVHTFDGRSVLRLPCELPGWVRANVEFAPNGDGRSLDVNVVATVTRPGVHRLGMRLLCIDCLCESERVRLMPALNSGWNEDGRGLFLYPRWDSLLPRQFTAIKDYTRVEPMVIHTKEQGLALNYPEGTFGGAKELSCGTQIFGGWHVAFTREDCWDPAVAEKGTRWAPPDPGIQPPRHSYDVHLARWDALLQRPELWVDFGDGCGFYHRGFYGVCRGEMNVSGTLMYDGPLCRDTGSDKLCELSWGGSANVLLAYTLYRWSRPWARAKADAICKGIVAFRPGGYQGQDGPLQGAWYNGWLVGEGRFSDRFGRDCVYTPDQGIANYFLGKCLLEGLTGEDRLVGMMEANCAYLETLEMPGGGVRFGLRPDGSTAIDRHEVSYDIYGGDMALAAGAAALSNLMVWRLTGNGRYRDKAKTYLDHQLAHIAQNNWRFHGYDTYGTNSQGLAWHLIILSEFLRDGFDEAAGPAERTMRHLLTFRLPYDLGVDRHSENERAWGGALRSRGTITTGSTRHYMQDYLNGHNRYDPGEALWAYYEVTGDARAYRALLDFENYLTYHQFAREDLPIGAGAVTEAMQFIEGHCQDTVQTLHSNPLQHVLLNADLFLQACGSDVAAVERRPGGVRFTLTAPAARETWFQIGGAGSERVTVRRNGDVEHIGMGAYVPCRVDGRTDFDVQRVETTCAT